MSPMAASNGLTPGHAVPYRALMLEAYERHPDAFTSSTAERAALPLAWWEARVTEGPVPTELVIGAFIDGLLSGVAGQSFETREKHRHKATLIVKTALDQATSRPSLALVPLTANQGNGAAQALYECCGYVAKVPMWRPVGQMTGG